MTKSDQDDKDNNDNKVVYNNIYKDEYIDHLCRSHYRWLILVP